MDTLQCAVVLAKLRALRVGTAAPPRARRALPRAAGRQPASGCSRCGRTATASGRSTPCSSTTARAVQAALQAQGIPTAVHYPQAAAPPAGLCRATAAPTAARTACAPAQRVLSLPMSADLTEADQDAVVQALLARHAMPPGALRAGADAARRRRPRAGHRAGGQPAAVRACTRRSTSASSRCSRASSTLVCDRGHRPLRTGRDPALARRRGLARGAPGAAIALPVTALSCGRRRTGRRGDRSACRRCTPGAVAVAAAARAWC